MSVEYRMADANKCVITQWGVTCAHAGRDLEERKITHMVVKVSACVNLSRPGKHLPVQSQQ